MSDIAQVVLTGRVGQDPEEKYINDTPLGTFSIAVDQYMGKNKKNTTAWWRIEVWGNLTRLLEYVKKGDAITVAGEVRQDVVENEGGKNTYYKVRASNIRLAPKGSRTSDGEEVQEKAKKKQAIRNEAPEEDTGW